MPATSHQDPNTTESHQDPNITELLRLAGVSPANAAARLWMADALTSAQAVAGAIPRPVPTQFNQPLEKVERAAGQLTVALEELGRHHHAHGEFWRFRAFGPIYADVFERPHVLSNVEDVRLAARNARVRSTGRPPKVRRQQIVSLALAFCA